MAGARAPWWRRWLVKWLPFLFKSCPGGNYHWRWHRWCSCDCGHNGIALRDLKTGRVYQDHKRRTVDVETQRRVEALRKRVTRLTGLLQAYGLDPEAGVVVYAKNWLAPTPITFRQDTTVKRWSGAELELVTMPPIDQADKDRILHFIYRNLYAVGDPPYTPPTMLLVQIDPTMVDDAGA